MIWLTLCTIFRVFVFVASQTEEFDGNATQNSFNYCLEPRCRSEHIACNHNGKFSLGCPNDVEVIDISKHKERILRKHNELRNVISSGRMEPFKAAARMAEMQWDDELAELATLHVKSCSVQSDECRSTLRFPYSGQNSGIFTYTGYRETKSTKWLIKNRLDYWISKIDDTTPRDIKRYPISKNIGSFTLMITDRNTHVGCAAVRFNMDLTNYFLLACNYAADNIKDVHVYSSTRRSPGRRCKAGRSEKYRHLCSKNEIYK